MPKLGELVEVRPAQEFAQARDPHIVQGSRRVGTISVRVLMHGSKLQDGKFLAAFADAVLRIHDGRTAVQKRGQCNDRPERKQDQQPNEAPSYVQHLIAGMHLHFPAFSRLARRGDAYALYPEAWVHAL